LGRHYIDDIIATRISSDSSGNLSITEGMKRRVPQPTNDILGRYIETNISVMTENRPMPRITPKSESLEDRQEAEMAELVIEYLWEELDLPESHRELARLLLYTGIGFLETYYDPFERRHMLTPDTETEEETIISSGMKVPVPREIAKLNPDGSVVFTDAASYGDIVSRVVSGFEMYLPDDRHWNRGDLPSGWIMKETYMPIESVKEMYLNPDLNFVNKRKGYFRENIEKVTKTETQNYALWWWQRLGQISEGPKGASYIGTPNDTEDYTPVRIYDRKPNSDWPKGRTIITAGNELIYDSPKSIGARVYDKRWPHRWHPYIRYRHESQIGSVYGRSMVSKMLPYLKRIDSIDATLIMYRRTVPIATWIMPVGSQPVEGLHSGDPGSLVRYDPNRTNRNEPKVVYPPPYPTAILQEREMALRHLEDVAGTEQILRGERPTGTTSGSMLAVLRNQALAAKSPTLQSFDESMQQQASALLQETKKHIKDDERYRRRISILARERASTFSVEKFSGTHISDNVNVKIDTVSQAMFAKEAKAQRAIEVMQYAPGLIQLPTALQAKLLEDLGWPDQLMPQGSDVARARMLIQFTKDGRFDLAIPMPEDDPYVIHTMLAEQVKSEGALNWSAEVLQHFFMLMDHYQMQIQQIEAERMQMVQMMGGQEGG